MYSFKLLLSLCCLFASLVLINSGGYAITNDTSQIAYGQRNVGDRNIGVNRGAQNDRNIGVNRGMEPNGADNRNDNGGYRGGNEEYNRGYVAPVGSPQEPVYVVPPTTTQPQR